MQFKSLKHAALVGTLAAGLVGAATSAQADYALPPAWMPMVMATISLDSAGALSMVDQSTFLPRCPGWSSGCFSSNPLPLTTNVLASGNPDVAATTFAQWDPAQPWSVLQNKGFSREFGWWGGAGTAPATLKSNVETTYGAGASIWIELQNQSAGLETYKAVGKFGVNANNTTTVDPTIGAYQGLFGTAGSSSKWQWDYQMDHNVYAVAQSSLIPNALYSATYKVYIGDSMGNELASAVGKSTVESWTWKAPAVVPVPEPETYAMFLVGIGLIGAIARRRRAV
ncbi:MAG: hypothetical protein H6R13_1788 [Proteobacteria bacterium]|nr:hypothetical protein [Pseudomonadota bacterium]